MASKIPNALSVLRLLLSLPIAWMLLRQHWEGALALGVLAALSDALDGVLARRLDSETELGARLDAVADKLLVTIAFVCFAMTALVPLWLAVVVVARDAVVLCGALAYRLVCRHIEVKPLPLGKLNMALQLLFCVAVLAQQVLFPQSLQDVMGIAVYVVALFAVVSGIQYVLVWSAKAIDERRHGERP